VFTDWPFVGRARELAHLGRLLAEDRCNGVVLTGVAGVGKTRLAVEALALAEHHGFAAVRATATNTARGIPFGAVATLLPVSPPSPAVNDRAAMIQRMAEALVERVAPRKPALLVDDAHLLDDATATLVHQLAASGAAFVLLTVRASEPVPDALLTLWKDRHAERITVEGLGAESIGEILGTVLGGPVDRGLVRRLVTRTRGNVMFIRELVLGAVEDGSLRDDEGLWRQVREIRPSERLVELVQARLSLLSPAQRAVLELLAFGEPLGSEQLHVLADPESIEELERRRLILGEACSRGHLLRLAHPLYADVVRARTPAIRAVAVARALAESFENAPEGVFESGKAPRPEDTLRIATWHLECGGGSWALMLEAAQAARWSYDFDLAARLAEAAVERGAGFPGRLLAIQVAALRGRGAEVERNLEELARGAGTDAERGAVALTRLDNVAFSLAKIDDALRLAECAEEEIADPAWKDEVRARRASFLLVAPSGGPRAAVAAAVPLLDRTAGSAKVWACFTVSCSLTRVGRMHEALHWAHEGATEHLKLQQPIEWHPWIHNYSRGEALAQLGQLREAGALAVEQYEKGIEERSVERQAFFAWQLATRVGEQGDVRSAIQRCREARGLYEQLGRPFFVRHCLVHLSLALALAGRPDEAAGTLSGLDAMDLPAQLFAYSGDLLHARAWTAVAQGDTRAARDFLQQGLALAETTGDFIGQATAMHGLARLGQARHVAPRLTAIVNNIEGDLFAARAAHARALARRNPERLNDVSQMFEDMGAFLLAAEAAAAEACIRRRKGENRKATAAHRRANALLEFCDGAVMLAVDGLGDETALTPAELRAAQRATVGRSNRQIAEEFHLSVRTVEHQLQSAYDKLGISRRDELADALPAPTH
jgi:DNA-binding CsgD family transcriptional regulator